MAVNIYNDMNVFDCIRKIQSKEIILPDIQREYCWQTSDIEELFYSIIKEFPIGSFIIWKTNGNNLNLSNSVFYEFLGEAKYKKKRGVMISKNKEITKRNFENRNYFVVLDGQQRLTSFYLVFNGIFKIKKIGSTGSDTNDNYFDEKELYYDLDHYSEDMEVDSNPFIFLTEEEKNDGNYYHISDMKKFVGDPKKFKDDLKDKTKGFNKKVREDLCTLFKRLSEEKRDQSLVHFFTINSDKYDDALDIFVKVNSSGKPLTKTDLLFSTLINGWDKDDNIKEGRRKEIEKYIEGINQEYGFAIDKDFLLRTIYIISNDGKSTLSMQEICRNDVIKKIRKSWTKAEKKINKTLKYLNQININDARVLSYNAIIPIIYYVYLGGKFNNDKSRDELKKYFAISFAKGLFGGSSNQAIENTCKDIKSNLKNEFNVNFFKNTDFSGGRTFKVDINNINDWMSKYEKGKKTYSLLMLVSPELNLLEEKYDQDHSYAESLFNEKKFKKEKININKLEVWRQKRNLLPNLSFMVGYTNSSKNAYDLDAWINKNDDKKSALRCLPIDIKYSFSNFEQFFVLRRSLMKYKLTKAFDVPGENIKEYDEVTLNEIPKEEIHLKYGMHGVVLNIENDYANVDFRDENNNTKGNYRIKLDYLYIVEDFDK